MNSLRRGCDSFIGMAQSRFELFAVELQEEKLRALNLIILLAVAVALGMVGLLVLVGLLGLYLWNLAGYLGLAGLAFALLAASVAVFLVIRHRIRTGPAPFAETISEFRKDRECLRRDD